MVLFERCSNFFSDCFLKINTRVRVRIPAWHKSIMLRPDEWDYLGDRNVGNCFAHKCFHVYLYDVPVESYSQRKSCLGVSRSEIISTCKFVTT